jgi:hypothetical protein
LPDTGKQPCRDFLEDPIAGLMTQAVVDGLEAIQIDEENRQRRSASPLRPGDRAADFIVKGVHVRQAGQGIMMGEPSQTVAFLDVCGNVTGDKINKLSRRGRLSVTRQPCPSAILALKTAFAPGQLCTSDKLTHRHSGLLTFADMDK